MKNLNTVEKLEAFILLAMLFITHYSYYIVYSQTRIVCLNIGLAGAFMVIILYYPCIK